MKKRIITLLLTILSAVAIAKAGMLPPDTKISILTSGPSDEAIFTKWGHTAIRVCSPTLGLDEVFNYGIFTFQDGFIVKFVKGETDYRLGTCSYEDALSETRDEKNAAYYEQELNLTPDEKEALFSALLVNYEPENRYYRYNFFFDNCATRAREMVRTHTTGTIIYPTVHSTETFRDVIHQLLKTSPWYAFGIDICLGSPTDKVMSNKDRLFIPMEMMKAYSQAKIVKGDSIQPLVKSYRQLNTPKTIAPSKSLFDYVTPMVLFWIIFAMTTLHIGYYYKTGKNDSWFYSLIFGLLGITGILVFFLSFFSVHPCVYPNYNLLWCNPLLLLPVLTIWIKKLRKINFYLFGLIAASNLTALSGYLWLPQAYAGAFAPIMLIEIALSAAWIYKNNANDTEKRTA